MKVGFLFPITEVILVNIKLYFSDSFRKGKVFGGQASDDQIPVDETL